MKILLIAEQANPEWVSVPLVGWSLCKAISALTDAHIVTQVRNRDAFNRAGLKEGEDYTAIDNEGIASPLHKISEALRGASGKGWTIATAFQSVAYYSFELALWRQFRQRIAAGEFQIVHRITPLSPTAPSLLASRCRAIGVPFVMGPLNGGLPWPPGFNGRRRSENEWLSYIRGFYKLLPGYRSSRLHSSIIFVGSQATRSQLPKYARSKAVYVPENGIDPARFSMRTSKIRRLPLVGIFVGRLVDYKCPDLLLRAAAPIIKSGYLRLNIVGDGPMRDELERYVKEEGIAQGVLFSGWVPHQQVQSELVLADFLVLPSVREFGGGVVLESMAVGVPPVVANYGGPGEIVSKKTGIKVEFKDAESLQENLRAALFALVENPGQLDGLSKAALEDVNARFTWAVKAKTIVDVYRGLLDTTPTVQAIS